MGKFTKVTGKIVRETITKPLFKRMAAETRSLDRRYNKFLSGVEQRVEVDRMSVSPHLKEAAAMFDLVIRFHDGLG